MREPQFTRVDALVGMVLCRLCALTRHPGSRPLDGYRSAFGGIRVAAIRNRSHQLGRSLLSDVRPADVLIHDPAPTTQQLFESLAARSVAVAVYKGSSRLAGSLAGEGDLDLVVAPDDLEALQDIVQALGGIRAFPSRFYDNAMPARQDWFLPLAGGRILHLDIASPIMVGRKFCKAYRLSHGASFREAAVPAVSVEDEAKFALARLAFNVRDSLARKPVQCPADLCRLLDAILPPGSNRPVWRWHEAEESADCTFRRSGMAIAIERRSLAAIRRAVRRANHASAFAPIRDWLVHTSRRAANALVTRMARLMSGSTMGKRHLRVGTIIALIGPDGVGKSTQSAALARHFGKKLACRAIYLGSNDGSWMRIRHKLALGRRRGASRKPGTSRSIRKRGWLHVHGSALWRLVIALQRRRAMRQALRMARRGAIAVADRWPQTLEPGLLDGPSVRPPDGFRLAHYIWTIEQRIYRSIERHKPGLTIHLDCDFATSHRRKPDDISAAAFAARLALMERMRRADERIVTVDARRSQDQVFADLCGEAWRHLNAINRT